MAGAARNLVRRALVRGLVVNLGALVVAAAPAAADSARPTNYRSTVTAVTPAEPDVVADVTGGDSFLRLRVAAGHSVVVLGYEDEPYLRVGTDGSVDENARSPATWLNRKRYGSTAPLPADVDAKATPNWRRIGAHGVALWHDHRVHWMSLTHPPQLGAATSGRVLDWTVKMEVDGKPAAIEGHLDLLPAPARWPWQVVAGVGVLGAVALGFRRPRGAALVSAGASIVVFGLQVVNQFATPAGVGRSYASVALPAVAAAAALTAWALRRTRYDGAFLAGTGVALAMTAWLSRAAIGHAVLPTTVSPVVVQIAVVAAEIGAAAALTAALRWIAEVVAPPPTRPASNPSTA
jgi:hypothetical protein